MFSAFVLKFLKISVFIVHFITFTFSFPLFQMKNLEVEVKEKVIMKKIKEVKVAEEAEVVVEVAVEVEVVVALEAEVEAGVVVEVAVEAEVAAEVGHHQKVVVKVRLRKNKERKKKRKFLVLPAVQRKINIYMYILKK